MAKRLRSKHIRYAASWANADRLPDVRKLGTAAAFREIWGWFKKKKVRIIRTKFRSAIMIRLLAFFPERFFAIPDHITTKLTWAIEETVHVIQWLRWGRFKFAWRYRDPRWRWAVEVQAKRAAFRDLASRADKKFLESRCVEEADKLSSGGRPYYLKRLDRKQARAKALQLFREAAGLT